MFAIVAIVSTIVFLFVVRNAVKELGSKDDDENVSCVTCLAFLISFWFSVVFSIMAFGWYSIIYITVLVVVCMFEILLIFYNSNHNA